MKKEHDSCSPLAWTWAPSSQTIPNAPSWNRLPTKPGHLGSETCWSVHVSTIGNLKKSVYRNIIRNDLQNACTRECSPFSIHDCLHSGSLNMEVEKTTFPCNQRVFHFHGPVSRSDLSFGVRRLGSGSSVAPSQRLSGGSAAWRGTTGPPHGRNARRGEVARSIDVRHRLQRGSNGAATVHVPRCPPCPGAPQDMVYYRRSERKPLFSSAKAVRTTARSTWFTVSPGVDHPDWVVLEYATNETVCVICMIRPQTPARILLPTRTVFHGCS